MKCRIYYIKQLFWLIILHSCIDVHSCLTVFMSGKVLNRFGVNACIQKIGNVGMTQQVGSYLEVQAIHNVGIIFLMPSQARLNRVLDTLAVHILIIGALFGRANDDVLPDPFELRIRQRLPFTVGNHIFRF